MADDRRRYGGYESGPAPNHPVQVPQAFTRVVARQEELQEDYGDDPRAELIEIVHRAIVEEVNNQMMGTYGRGDGLAAAQAFYRQIDMEKLAEAALDSFQDHVALEIAKNVSRQKGISDGRDY